MIAGSVCVPGGTKSAERTADVGIQCVSVTPLNSSSLGLTTVVRAGAKLTPAPGGRIVGLDGLIRWAKSLRE